MPGSKYYLHPKVTRECEDILFILVKVLEHVPNAWFAAAVKAETTKTGRILITVNLQPQVTWVCEDNSFIPVKALEHVMNAQFNKHTPHY